MTITPITVEVVRNAVNAYADEMATALCKSAYNMMIYEVRDYCCGLLDAQARMISQNRGGLPIFLADLGVAVVMTALPVLIPLVIILMRKLRTTEVQL